MNQQALKIYQLFPLVHSDIIVRQLAKSKAFGASAWFDLEDSVMDPSDPEVTPTLKATARENLLTLAENVRIGAINSSNFNIRINHLGSTALRFDLEALAEANIEWEGIFVPRIERPEQLEAFTLKLETHGIATKQLIPIVETAAGLNNLDALFQGRPESVQQAFFGNYDYHLDINRFPVAEPWQEDYWRIVEPIVATLESHGVHFGNSPFTRLKDDPAFLQLLERLDQICSLPFAQITLRLHQTKLCRYYSQSVAELERLAIAPDQNRLPIEEAEAIVRHFELHRSRGITPEQLDPDGRLITPQEYLLAREQIRQRTTALAGQFPSGEPSAN